MLDKNLREVDFNKTTQQENDAAEKMIIDKWEKLEMISRILMFTRLGLVVFGIAAEIIFISLNIGATKSKNEKPAEIRIEMSKHGDSSIIVIDTSGKSNIQIKFQNL